MERTKIERLLPAVIRQTSRPGTPLPALLAAMERLHERTEEQLRHMETVFDPRRADPQFVIFLAHWVNLDTLLKKLAAGREIGPDPLPSGFGNLRELIASAAELSRWRGTGKGLKQFLETATGIAGVEIVEKERFHILVRIPKIAALFEVVVRSIIEFEKPVHVTYELVTRED
jgi:phage tail-like protein